VVLYSRSTTTPGYLTYVTETGHTVSETVNITSEIGNNIAETVILRKPLEHRKQREFTGKHILGLHAVRHGYSTRYVIIGKRGWGPPRRTPCGSHSVRTGTGERGPPRRLPRSPCRPARVLHSCYYRKKRGGGPRVTAPGDPLHGVSSPPAVTGA
jgi:hypothetical protein